MKTYSITLTADQLMTLQTFLKRINLSGAEVPRFLALVHALQRAKEKEPNKPVSPKP